MTNPFDMFGDEGKKEKKPAKKKAPPPPEPTEPPPSDDEVKKMMDRMATIHEEIRDTVSAAFGEQGVSEEELTVFLNEPEHFTDEQWSLIREERERWEQKLWVQMGPGGKEKVSKEKQKKKKKKQKGKMLGARKKWLEMR